MTRWRTESLRALRWSNTTGTELAPENPQGDPKVATLQGHTIASKNTTGILYPLGLHLRYSEALEKTDGGRPQSARKTSGRQDCPPWSQHGPRLPQEVPNVAEHGPNSAISEPLRHHWFFVASYALSAFFTTRGRQREGKKEQKKERCVKSSRVIPCTCGTGNNEDAHEPLWTEEQECVRLQAASSHASSLSLPRCIFQHCRKSTALSSCSVTCRTGQCPETTRLSRNLRSRPDGMRNVPKTP